MLSFGAGLEAGALTYFALDRPLERRPEIGIASGDGVGVALLVAIFVSNLPEGLGSPADMLAGGRARREVVRLWSGVAVVCAAACVAGYALADVTGGTFSGIVDGFAAGALLVMLAGAMFPEARAKSGLAGGLVVALGFAVSASLSSLS